MQQILIQTLIDITRSKNVRPGKGDGLELNQFINFTTLLQCIELRSVINYDQNPLNEIIELPNNFFGSSYRGNHKVWKFTFRTDRNNVYDNDGNPLGKLIEDIHGVPILKSLTETINIDRAIFDCKDKSLRNTVITLYP